jgi:co-chaperonin GroES (HSP10)
MPLRPLKNKVIVEVIPEPTETKGGLIIPDVAIGRFKQGIVKGVGPECKEVKFGDYVLFSGYSGTLVDVADDHTGRNREYAIVIPEDFITCVLEPNLGRTPVPGLYLKDSQDGSYFGCDIFLALRLIAQAIGDSEWNKDFLRTLVVHKDSREFETAGM